jgi:hypothetical protein
MLSQYVKIKNLLLLLLLLLCVSAANAVCKEIYIFNKDKITLVDIS